VCEAGQARWRVWRRLVREQHPFARDPTPFLADVGILFGANLQSIEPTLNDVSAATLQASTAGTANTFTVVSTANSTSDAYTIRATNGTVTRSVLAREHRRLQRCGSW
jgi:hypothetical protein